MNVRDGLPILLVEDNGSDAELIKQALRLAGVHNAVTWLETGEEAAAYLEGLDRYADREAHPLPRLILLDLKLAKLSGFSVLKLKNEKPALRDVPAIVITGSLDPADIDEVLQLGAASYLIKPKLFDDLVELLRVKVNFCLSWKPKAEEV